MVLRSLGFVVRAVLCVMLFNTLALFCGCRATPPSPTAVPQTINTLTFFSGTPLSGPMPTAVAVGQPASAWSIHIKAVALEKWPGDRLEPISSKARLIAVTLGGEPVASAARVGANARMGAQEISAEFRQQLESEALGGHAEIGAMTGALPPGVTAQFESADQPGTPRRSVGIVLSRPADAGADAKLRLGLIVQDIIAPPVATSPEEAGATTKPAANPLPQRENVLLDDLPFEGPMQAVVLVPFTFAATPHQAVAFLVDVSPGSDEPAHVEAVQRCAADLQRSAAEAASRPQLPLLSTDDSAGIRSAVASLAQPQSRRPALVFLTTQTDAPLCGDVVLTCDDDVLAVLASRIWQAATPEATKSPQAFGWALDYLTLRMLADMQSSNTKIAPELAAVLTRHCGEAGRHASSLDEVLKGATSKKDLENRLIAENLIYLEDSSPASRVRAYDWLRGSNHAPAGYEPLAPTTQRRDALERALSGATPTTQQGQP